MDVKRLASGTLVELDERGRATVLRCNWLIQVASNNPEPDSLADCFIEVDCGRPVRSLDGKTDLAHTTCEAGHDRHEYGSAAWLADDLAFEARLRADEEAGLR